MHSSERLDHIFNAIAAVQAEIRSLPPETLLPKPVIETLFFIMQEVSQNFEMDVSFDSEVPTAGSARRLLVDIDGKVALWASKIPLIDTNRTKDLPCTASRYLAGTS